MQSFLPPGAAADSNDASKGSDWLQAPILPSKQRWTTRGSTRWLSSKVWMGTDGKRRQAFLIETIKSLSSYLYFYFLEREPRPINFEVLIFIQLDSLSVIWLKAYKHESLQLPLSTSSHNFRIKWIFYPKLRTYPLDFVTAININLCKQSISPFVRKINLYFLLDGIYKVESLIFQNLRKNPKGI